MAVRIDQGALDRVLNSPGGPVAKAVLESAIRVENAAKRLCPVDEGRLRASITHTTPRLSITGPSVQVYSDVEYALFVHEGTSPHEITGNPLLAWNGDDGPAFARSVQHPGTKAQPYLRDACPAAL